MTKGHMEVILILGNYVEKTFCNISKFEYSLLSAPILLTGTMEKAVSSGLEFISTAGY